MKRTRFIGLLLLLPAMLQATNLQNSDSSQQLLDTTHGKAKIMLLIKLSEQNRNKSAYGCKQYYQQAFSLAKTNNNKDLMGLSSKTMGVSYFYWGDMQNAHKYFREGLYYYRQSGNKKGQSNCLNDIGLVYEGWADFDSAAYYYKASYLIEKELENAEGEATSLINMGNIDYYRKAYPDALADYFKALKKFIQANDQNGIAMAYNSLAIIYTQIGDFNKALKYLDKARSIYSVTGNIRKLSRVLNNMADIYSGHLKEYRKAEILYNKVLGIKKELGDKEGIALVKCNLGVMYGQMENLSLALKYFDESLLIYHQTGDKTGISMVHQNKAKALQVAGMYRKALKEYRKSLAISTKTGLKSFTINNYLGIFKCYAALGEYNNFNKYFNLFEKSRDTISKKLEKDRITELEAQYKIDTLLRQKKSLREESRRKEIKIQRYYILSISLSLIVIFLIIALILYKRAKKETKKYEVKE
jgi:tetratricopeptide (TPR) repeat protein